MLLEPGQQFFFRNMGVAIDVVDIERSTIQCRLVNGYFSTEGGPTAMLDGDTILVSIEFNELEKLVANRLMYFNDPDWDWSSKNTSFDDEVLYPTLQLA